MNIDYGLIGLLMFVVPFLYFFIYMLYDMWKTMGWKPFLITLSIMVYMFVAVILLIIGEE